MATKQLYQHHMRASMLPLLLAALDAGTEQLLFPLYSHWVRLFKQEIWQTAMQVGPQLQTKLV